MTDDFADDEIHELLVIRSLLEPPTGAADRVVSAALELGQRRRRPRVAAAGVAIAAGAAALALLARSRGKSTPRIQMSNAGSVVFVETDRGQRWAISGSRFANKKSIVIAKGGDR
jgi:hypothetical protein